MERQVGAETSAAIPHPDLSMSWGHKTHWIPECMSYEGQGACCACPPQADANHVFSAAALNFTIFDWGIGGLVIDRVRKVGDLCVDEGSCSMRRHS